MYGKQKGFTLIEILVVVTIIGVLAGLVVVLIPKSQFEQAKLGCTNNVRNLVGLLQQTATANSKYPNESGPNMLLYYVVRRDGLDPDSEDRLNLLFCPADAQEDLDKAGGKEAFKKLDLSKRDYGALTSYAVNDQENGSCAVKPTGPDKVLLADDDEEHHDRKGFVVGLTNGTAKWWDKYEKWEISVDTKIEVGEASEREEFQCLRAE